MELEPFLKDVVDVQKDHGEPWLIGYRKRVPSKAEQKKRSGPKGIKGPAKPPRKKEDDDKDKVGIFLRLRRCPTDVNRTMGNMYRSEREKTDAFGNKVQDFYYTPDNFEAFLSEKARWMFLDTENFVVEIDDDPETIAMYNRAVYPEGPQDGKGIKAGAKILLDGKWNDELRSHFINRYKWLRNEIMKANVEYENIQSVKDEFLRGN
jgi:hypothetical protein